MQLETFGMAGLFISAFISSTIAPGGSEAVLAYLVNSRQHAVEQLVMVATVGNTLGALTTWWLGMWAAKKYPAETLLTGKQRKSLRTVRQWGSWALLFSWLPVVGDGLCFAAGWLRLSLFSSILAIFFGKALRYIAVAYAFI
ncbi:YqaA family protein [Methylomonas rivi]|uniref:DedA family protein n=1 Tax=Methylomonas rivi TaxID=2952226 RepID=A0ABT1U1W6_9GAMM|nr:YqaA family protein [Methylomonas sp. WSC-6]MBS4052067.1 DedA family protein [Methylomonas sp.]MCQ8127445.1 DedA family protein [Methylomonas sp. WSC-6]